MDDYTVMKELLELCSKYGVNVEFCEDHTIRLKSIEYSISNPPRAYYKRLSFYPEIAAFSLEDLIKDFDNEATYFFNKEDNNAKQSEK